VEEKEEFFDPDQEIPLLGRGEELEALMELLDKVSKGKGAQVAMITGEPGIGKTRLAEELLNKAESLDFIVLRSQCFADTLIPYLPISEALKQADLEHLTTFDKPPKVEQVLVLDKDGTVITSSELGGGELDLVTFSGLLNFISKFIKDSMEQFTDSEMEEGALNSLEYGKNTVLVDTRMNGSIAVFLSGKPTEILKEEIGQIMQLVNPIYLQEDHTPSEEEESEMMDLFKLFISKYDGVDYVTEPRDRQWRLFENISMGLKHLAQEQPVLLFLDDLQWADPSSISLLHAMVRTCSEASLLILGTYRVGITDTKDSGESSYRNLQESLSGEELLKEVSLARFDEITSRKLLSHMIGDLSKGELGDMVVKEGRGNPLYLKEMASYFIREGVANRISGKWVMTGSIESIGLPEKMKDLIQTQLDKLTQEQREILECASVIGNSFRSSTLGAVLKINRLRLLRTLRNLEQNEGLIHRLHERGLYNFDNEQVRNILYSGLKRDQRRKFHSTVVELLLKDYNEGITDVLPELAQQAYMADHPLAVVLCKNAGDMARGDFNNKEAWKFYNMALEVGMDPDKSKLLESLGDLELEEGDLEGSLIRYKRAREYAADDEQRVLLAVKRGKSLEKLGRYQDALEVIMNDAPGQDEATLAMAQWLSATSWLYFRTMKYEESLENAEEAIRIFESEGFKGADLSDCWTTIGSYYSTIGKLEEAIDVFRNALSFAKENNLHVQAIRLQTNIALAQRQLGRFNEAIETTKEAQLMAERTGNKYYTMICHMQIGSCHYSLGDLDEAYRLHTLSLTMAGEIGAVRYVSYSLWGRCITSLYLGMNEEAESDARKALEQSDEAADEYLFSLLYLSEVLAVVGKGEEALEIATKAETGFLKYKYNMFQAGALRNLALAKAILGDREGSEEAFKRSLVEEGHLLEALEYAKGLRWWGEALAGWGEKEKAKEKLFEARERCMLIGAKGELARVKKALEGL
jgi:tetratricopeptide (TPR) repeat protein